MNRQRRRVFAYLGLVVGSMAAFTLLYSWGMATFEGEPRTLLESLHIVTETFATVGYGEDAPWHSPVMLALMVLMQFSGVFIVFLALPLVVAPWLEEQFAVSPPESTNATDHVLVCGETERVKHLTDGLAGRNVPYVIVEPDREAALELDDDGHTVVHADYETGEGLRAAGVSDARAVVLDAGDETNAAVALTVSEFDADPRVVGFVEDPEHARYVSYAGADQVLSPRNLLGHGIANKVTSAITARLGDTVEIGTDFELVELPIQDGSPLVGATLSESGIREQTGADIIGVWFGGQFTPNPGPDRTLTRDTVLLAAGNESQLEALVEHTQSRERKHRPGRVVIVGAGEVGTTALERIQDAGVECTVVDWNDGEHVDVVGDATEEGTLEAADLQDASALVVALGSDTDGIFTTLVARELAPEVEVICRANATQSAPRLYAAGADYVLTLATVSGRMLVASVLDENVVTAETQIELVRATAPELAGETLAEADIRARTDSTIIAVERDGEVLTDLGPTFRIEAGDPLVVAGTDDAVQRFNALGGGESS
mgnify:CR=1 FL=1